MYNKKYNNEVAAAGLLIALIFALIFSTNAIAYFMLQIYGINVIAPELNNNELRIRYNSTQDFADNGYDLEILGKGTRSKWVFNPDVGMVFTESGLYPISFFVIDDIQKDSRGLYQNIYEINNSATDIYGSHGDYCILLRFTEGSDQNEICITKEGFEIPNYWLGAEVHTGTNFKFSYPNANEIHLSTIKTVYNDKSGSLNVEFYFNGDKIFETTKLHEEGINIFGKTRYYGGVSTSTIGFTFIKFSTSGDIISGGESNPLSDVAGFITTVWKIATFSLPVSVPFPTELSFLFDIMLFGIFVCLVVIWRG